MSVSLSLALLTVSLPDATEGRQLFHDPGLGRNGVSCASCHSVVESEEKEGDGLLRAGHSLFGVARRKHWRGDVRRAQHSTLAEATEVCAQLFMGADALTPRERVALDAYLRAISPKATMEALQLAPALEADLDYRREKYMGGDADQGRTLFFKSCHGCHPKGGRGVAPPIAGKELHEVARKVREGNGLLRGNRKGGEWMPFFGSDRLTDRQVADLAAYVHALVGDK